MLEDRISRLVAVQKYVKEVVLMCTSLNMIDASALQSLEMICARLQTIEIRPHLSEVK